jgi:hypothetical protein
MGSLPDVTNGCAKVQTMYFLPLEENTQTMPKLKSEKEFYSEVEAAEALGISVDRLHLLLKENVFNDGSSRPDQLTFRATDLILMEFWDRTLADNKVVRMPKR